MIFQKEYEVSLCVRLLCRYGTFNVTIFDEVLGERAGVKKELANVHDLAWDVVDKELLSLCKLRVAMILGCDEEVESAKQYLDPPRLTLLRSGLHQISLPMRKSLVYGFLRSSLLTFHLFRMPLLVLSVSILVRKGL